MRGIIEYFEGSNFELIRKIFPVDVFRGENNRNDDDLHHTKINVNEENK